MASESVVLAEQDAVPVNGTPTHVDDGAVLERENTLIQGLTRYFNGLVLLLVRFTHYSCLLEIP